MTSFGADKNMKNFGFLITNKIQRLCYLLPLPKEFHKFVLEYFMGGNQKEAQMFMWDWGMFHQHHKYVSAFQYTRKRDKELKKSSSKQINIQLNERDTMRLFQLKL